MTVEHLYFIAIVPPDEINGQILAIKKEFSERFGSSHALNAPAHITLHMPFKWKESKLDLLESHLYKCATSCITFSISLNGFKAFAPRVIYVDVIENQQLVECQRAVLRSMRQLHILNADYKDKPFHPHMTVAFRDLKKTAFQQAWEAFSQRSFSASFEAKAISLLKHEQLTGQKAHWNVYKQFGLMNV